MIGKVGFSVQYLFRKRLRQVEPHKSYGKVQSLILYNNGFRSHYRRRLAPNGKIFQISTGILMTENIIKSDNNQISQVYLPLILKPTIKEVQPQLLPFAQRCFSVIHTADQGPWFGSEMTPSL